jgi:hypothetical protein
MPSLPNLKAAQAVVSSRLRIKRGLARGAAKKPLTLRDAEARYAGSARASIGRIVRKLEAANSLDYEDVVDPKMGRPRQLTDEEEEAIVNYIIWMDRSGCLHQNGKLRMQHSLCGAAVILMQDRSVGCGTGDSVMIILSLQKRY